MELPGADVREHADADESADLGRRRARHRLAVGHKPRPEQQRRRRLLLLGATATAGLTVAAVVLGGIGRPSTLSSARADGPADVVVPAEVLPQSAGPAPVHMSGPGTPVGDSRYIDITMGATSRGYFLLPALGLAAGQPAALLVVLHQDVSSGREISVDLGLDGLRRQGITLAYPDGYGGSWNAGACCGAAAAQRIDDVDFVRHVLDDVGKHTAIDPDRRALLGYSGGGMLTYRLLCLDHPRLVAAVEVGGSLEAHCPSGTRMPDLLAVHGAKDGSVGLTVPRFVTHLHMAPRAVVSSLAVVATQAGCGPRRSEVVNGIDVWTYPDCRGGSAIQAQIVPDAGHGWADVGGAARAAAFLVPRLTEHR